MARSNMHDELAEFAVCLAAYNEPDLLTRALTSVANQDYRPLTVIVSDDAGPTPLGKVVDSFRVLYPDISWVYMRQTVNLGVARNKIWLFSQVSQEFCCFLEHDDMWVSKTFLSDSICLMHSAPDVNLCIGNAEHEFPGRDGAKRLMYNNTVPYLQLEEDWQLVSGEKVAAAMLLPITTKSIVLNALRPGPFYPLSASWSSLTFRTRAVRESHGLNEESLVPLSEEKNLSTYSNEESFGFVFKLLAMGPVFLTRKPVSMRGAPATAFSNSVNHPGRDCKNDVEFFNLTSASRSISPHNPEISQLLLKRAQSIGLGKINSHVLAFVGTGPAAFRIVLIARLRSACYKLLRLFLTNTKKHIKSGSRWIKRA